MSEDRFRSYDGNMAEKIAKRLPRVHDIDHMEPFYQKVLRWCLENHELIRKFPKTVHDDQAFLEFLEDCKDENNVEAFGMAIALRLEWLQRY